MKTKNKSILDTVLEGITPLDQAKTDAKMILATRIADAMQKKNWKNKDLLKAVEKDNPSIITKWLSGTHNFTVDTIVELEKALDVTFLKLEDEIPVTINLYIYEAVKETEITWKEESSSFNRFQASIYA